MVYAANVWRVLVSCPGDVALAGDLRAVSRAVTRWNVLLGEDFETVVVPVNWSDHAASEFGEPAQTVLDRQLVDVVDAGIAIFWSRLGTPTDQAESGTAQEIKRLHDAGKPVSILRCIRPIPPGEDLEQQARLAKYLRETEMQSLVIEYDDQGALERQVDNRLTRWARENRALTASPSVRSQAKSYVIASTDKRVDVEPNSKGQLKKKTRHSLTFRNTGEVEARNINWELKHTGEGDGLSLPYVGGTREPAGVIPVLAPGGDRTYPMMTHSGISSEFLCRITWDENGEARDSETTLQA